MSDLRSACRALGGNPGFTAVVIATLAIAIGANTAIFSVYDQLVLHPVSIPDPDSLVAIWFNNPQRNVQTPSISIPRYQELREQVRGFASIGLSAFDSFTLTGNGDPAQLNGLRVDPTFFPTLGIMPGRGRNFTSTEDLPNGPAVCIVSHELWQSQLGSSPELIGRTIQLNGVPWQVVGIMPPQLSAPFRQVQVFAPRVFEANGLTPAQIQAGATFAQAIARLRPGVSIEQVRQELAEFSRGYKGRHPASIDANNISEPRSYVAALVSGFEPTMYTLLGAVTCILLIACANIASLFLSRLLKRRREIAVRLALGATRAAILKQHLVESLVFSISAAAAGTLLTLWALKALQAIVASQLPPNTQLALNWRAFVFAGGVTLLATMLTGLFPSVEASRADVVEQLKDTTRGGTASVQSGRLRRMLIVGEVMLSVVLLVGAALLLVSFVKLQSAPAGFDASGVASAFVGLPMARYATPAQQGTFFEEVITQLRSQPNVAKAAVGFTLPLLGAARTPYGVAGQPLPPAGERPIVGMNVVSDDYFRLLAIGFVAGRGFNADDRATAPGVAVVNETFARRVFPDKSAIGEALVIGATNRRIEIVGVIRDVKSAGVNVPTPDELYLPLRQAPRPGLLVAAKTDADAAALQTAIRRAVAAVDPIQPISFFSTMETTVAQSLGAQRLVATLTVIFSVLSLLLALTGLYSVLAYLVAQRTSEIGIRMALGANRHQVVGLVMRNGFAIIGVGLILGLGAAAGISQLIRQLLFGVEPLNPAIYAGVAALFAAVGALACLAPSMRASRIDPLIAFRTE